MAAFVLSFREGLEAALIIGILLGALRRLGRGEMGRFIWYGVATAVVVSVATAGGLAAAGIALEGRTEQIFEGALLLLAATFLTGMIFWMQRQGAAWRAALATNVRTAAQTGGWSLFGVAFLAVAREGIELALLLVATTLSGSVTATLPGAALGIAAATLTGVLFYQGVLRLNLAAFFRITNALLLLFAAGMIGLAAHELIEAGLLPAVIDPLWNINPILSDKSLPGELLKSLFGYNGNPALTEALAYVGYLVGIGWLLRSGRPSTPDGAATA
ncbi:MAG: FTR1 family iron permease [Anaerolineae bacterium]